MKTLNEIKQEVDKLLSIKKSDYADEETFDKVRKKAQGELAFLKIVGLYLENNPSEEAVKKDHAETFRHLKFIEDNYATWKKNNVIRNDVLDSELRSKYHTEMQKSKYTKQLKTLSYLLQ